MPKHSNQLGHLVTTKLLKNQGLSLSFRSSYVATTNIELFAVPKPVRNGISEEEPIFINYSASKTVQEKNIPIGGKETDIIISPFPPETWENIYSVKVTPKKKNDYVGFIAEFTVILEQANINILSLQSNPTFSEEPYSFWLLIDLSRFDPLRHIDKEISKLSMYLSCQDPYHYETRTKGVKTELKKILEQIISVTEIRGVQFLYNFSKEMKNTQPAYWNKIKRNKNSIRFKVKNGIGTIPPHVINSLIGFQNNIVQHAIVSSPHQKSFFILRIFEDSDIMYLDINNKDEIGSIEKISQVIKTHRGNVLTGTAQIESVSGTSCHYYVLVQSSPRESVNILKGLSIIEQVPRVIVYNCSPKNRSEIQAQLRNFPKIEIVSKSRFKEYFAQPYRHFLEKHNLSRENIVSQLAMGIIVSSIKLICYGISLVILLMLSKGLVLIGFKFFGLAYIIKGAKAFFDWM